MPVHFIAIFWGDVHPLALWARGVFSKKDNHKRYGGNDEYHEYVVHAHIFFVQFLVHGSRIFGGAQAGGGTLRPCVPTNKKAA